MHPLIALCECVFNKMPLDKKNYGIAVYLCSIKKYLLVKIIIISNVSWMKCIPRKTSTRRHSSLTLMREMSESFFFFRFTYLCINGKKKNLPQIYYSSAMWLICRIMQMKTQLGSNSPAEFFHCNLIQSNRAIGVTCNYT